MALVNIHSIITTGFTKANSTAFLSLVISASKALYFGWVLLLGWEPRKLPFCYGSSASTPHFGAANPALNIHRVVIEFYHCADCHRHARWCSRKKNLLNTRNKFFLTLTDRQVQAQEQATKMSDCNNEANILEPYNKIHKYNHSITPHQGWEEKLGRKVSGTAR